MRRISLSSDTFQSRISDMWEDVKDQVINEVKTSPVFFFKWMLQQMLLPTLNCLFALDIFILETLKRSSCFVRNCKLQQVQIFCRCRLYIF